MIQKVFGKINGRYVIACTSTFGQVGDYIDFYQADGTIIHGIIGDIKNQNDPACTEWGHDNGQTIVEFVVDHNTWYNSDHANPGTPTCHPEWNQFIVKAVNGGSYFDNPDFGTDEITPNEDSNSESSESELLYWPTDGTNVTSEFGLRESPTEGASSSHRGIDIGVASGTNVYACEAGTVTTAGWSDSAGNWVVIDHGNGYVSKYMHNSQVNVSAGDTVEKGQVIAISGDTGISTGPHLHFQIEYNGTAVDPMSFKYNNGEGNGTGGIGSNVDSAQNSTVTYYAKVATWNEVTDQVESNDPDVESYSTTTYNMTTTQINYLDFVKAYTMPFDYLWALLVVSQDQGFVLELADLVHNSEIEITVHDNLSINTNVNTYTYTEVEKIISDGVKIDGYSEESGRTVRIMYPPESDPQITSVDREVVHTVITKTNTLETDLTKANVWIVNYTKNYTYEIPEDVVTEGGAGALEDIPEALRLTTQTDDIGYGESQRQYWEEQWKEEVPDIVATLERVYCDYYYSTINRNESITNTLEKTTYVSSPANIDEKTDKDASEPNFVTILLDEDNLKAKHILLDSYSSRWLFEILRRNESTEEIFVDLTKYLFHMASGKSYGVDEFNFNIFYPGNLTSVGGDDYIVNIDMSSPEIVIDDVETLKRAFAGSGGAGSSNLVQYAEDFLRLQEEYRVNAVFAAAVTTNECGAGTNLQIGGNNWFSIKDPSGGWMQYDSPVGSIEAFCNQIANLDYYFTEGNYTVRSIGMTYCEDADAPGGWIENVLMFMTNMYQAAGIDVTPESGATETGQAIIEAAREKLGCLYIWGAAGPDTFDCSGLTQWCYKQVGIYIEHYTETQKSQAKNIVPVSEARPGDILYKYGHVAIYIGNGQLIEAPGRGKVVRIDDNINRFECALQFY